jgi:hypothetical protein
MLVTEDGVEKTKPRLVGLIAAADIERERTAGNDVGVR